MNLATEPRSGVLPPTVLPPMALIVEDDEQVAHLLGRQLEHLGFNCRTASSAEAGFMAAQKTPVPEVALIDVRLPGISGIDLLEQLKQLDEYMQVVMISAAQDVDTVRRCLRNGAYDYLIKPYDPEDLESTLKHALEHSRLLRSHDRYRQELERQVAERTHELRQTRDIALLTLARLAESRDVETGLHLERIAAYSRRLAEQLRQGPYNHLATDGFIEQLTKSSPLHDIGKVGIPDAILRKPGPLTVDEMDIMRTHTSIGGDTLRSVIRRFEGHSFLTMAMQIAYHHHERWDGSGYPRRLAGRLIPLAARIVALVDAYDTITNRRPYKPALSHETAVERISIDSGHHFDPLLVDAFLDCRSDFQRIHDDLARRERSSPSDGFGWLGPIR